MECARIACKHFIQPNRIESMGSLLFKLKSNFGIKKCECEQSECNIVEHVYCVVRWAKWFIKHGRDGKHTAWIMQYRRILCSVQCSAMRRNAIECSVRLKFENKTTIIILWRVKVQMHYNWIRTVELHSDGIGSEFNRSEGNT